ncbi:hypothetical protein GCM10027570_00150 [Streptomonospora sediminis]
MPYRTEPRGADAPRGIGEPVFLRGHRLPPAGHRAAARSNRPAFTIPRYPAIPAYGDAPL